MKKFLKIVLLKKKKIIYWLFKKNLNFVIYFEPEKLRRSSLFSASPPPFLFLKKTPMNFFVKKSNTLFD